MPDAQLQAWLPLVVAAIGAITGITGAVMGVIAYRRTNNWKKLDLRVALRRDAAELRSMIAGLPKLLQQAKQSRTAVMSAAGRNSASEKLIGEVETDTAAILSLEKEQPSLDADYSNASDAELEAQVIAVHALKLRAGGLRAKYQISMQEDDKTRDRIATLHRR